MVESGCDVCAEHVVGLVSVLGGSRLGRLDSGKLSVVLVMDDVDGSRYWEVYTRRI